MQVFTVFISSVQKEFAVERQVLYQHFKTDALLSQFFRPVIFEQLPAHSQSPDKVYLNKVAQSQIYLGLLGSDYGFEDAEGVSPTEREYNHAAQLHIERWIFIKGDSSITRHPKEATLINRVQQEVSRKRFSDTQQLLQEVNQCCVVFLQKQGLIQHTSFDASVLEDALMRWVDEEKLQAFIRVAKAKRGFPLPEGTAAEKVLLHLGMLTDGKPVNSALLVFAKRPQQFFPSAIVKCAHFHGTEVSKPIPDHKQYGGDVFEQIDQAVDFVLSKINISVGTREEGNAFCQQAGSEQPR
jgi:ATP-dependent DNA helicase RecG